MWSKLIQGIRSADISPCTAWTNAGSRRRTLSINTIACPTLSCRSITTSPLCCEIAAQSTLYFCYQFSLGFLEYSERFAINTRLEDLARLEDLLSIPFIIFRRFESVKRLEYRCGRCRIDRPEVFLSLYDCRTRRLRADVDPIRPRLI